MQNLDRLRWYAHRLRAMSISEIGHRISEKLLHRSEASFLQNIAAQAASLVTDTNSGVPNLPDPALAPAELRSALAQEAENIISGKWQLFGWRKADVGTPPAWHRDPIGGVVLDSNISAHRLNHRHLPIGADARTIWEINRWTEMTRLAMHTWINGDHSAAITAQTWLQNWCDQNPTGFGINWTSPLEAALRLLNFAWFDAIIRALPQSEPLQKTQDALIARIVPFHTAWIWRYRSRGSSANNHLLGELAALTVAVSRWPNLRTVSCPAEEAWNAMGSEILHQFATDGGSREQALHYHLFALDMSLQAALAIGCKSGPVHARLVKAARYFCDLAHAQEPWDFGDSDDAQVVPLTTHRGHSVAEWKAWFDGKSTSLTFLLGPSLLQNSTNTSTDSTPPSENKWQHYEESGMAVLNSPSWKLRLDASPLGFGNLAAHGHHDALHLSVWDGDQALIIDPGTGGYFGAKKLRTQLASWDAHNGPQPVNGFQTPRRIGTFLQVNHHPSPTLQIDGSKAIANFLHESHDFTRTVQVVDDKILINDAEQSNKPFRIKLIFDPDCTLEPIPVGQEAPQHLQLIRKDHKWQLTFTGQVSDATVLETQVSRAYGQVETAPAIAIEGTGPLSTAISRVC